MEHTKEVCHDAKETRAGPQAEVLAVGAGSCAGPPEAGEPGEDQGRGPANLSHPTGGEGREPGVPEEREEEDVTQAVPHHIQAKHYSEMVERPTTEVLLEPARGRVGQEKLRLGR